MTISTTANRTSATGGNTVGQEVPFTFPIVETSDLVVTERVTATGVETTLTKDTDYRVTIDDDNGGTVTMLTAIATSSDIHVVRAVPRTQSLDLEQGGAFSAENVEDALDRGMIISSDLADDILRSLRAPSTDAVGTDLELPSSVDRASKYLFFDSDGNATATAVVDEGIISFGTLGQSIAESADEAAFKALVNLEAGTDYQAYSSHLAALTSISKTDGNFIVANGTTWVAESATTALSSLGFSTFAKTIIDDTDAATVRATISALGSDDLDDILTSAGEILSWGGNVLTWTDS